MRFYVLEAWMIVSDSVSDSDSGNGPENKQVGGIDNRGPVLANQKWRIQFLSRVTGPILKGEGPGPGHTL